MSHRNELLSLLKNYSPTPEEKIFKDKMLIFIHENPDCFQRSLKIGHITGSAWLLNHTGEKALLMHHAKLDLWVQLGGHADGDSNILNVAIKEAQEESGVLEINPISPEIFDIDIHNVGDHFHYDVRFLLQMTTDAKVKQNHESKGFYWVSKNEPLPTKERSVLRMHEKWSLH